VRNIQKITRTMELIATARFKKAMDRATAATAYTQRMTQLVADLSRAGLEVSHPLLEKREATDNALLLMLSANRGLCGGYNGSVLRLTLAHRRVLQDQFAHLRLEVSGKRGMGAMRFRKIPMEESYTHFEDKPTFDEVEVLANRFLDQFIAGELDRVDVVYTRFVSSSRQVATVETLLPLSSLSGTGEGAEQENAGESRYEFLPSAESILQEVVPASFKVKLFKCFLDAAVSEQISRMVAMKSATENAQDMIRQLSMTYNRARQTQITNEIMEVIGGVEALES
ncbi:MAG: ATP synthase F1 subunit gamma, partial [Pirellulaceae bacterium]